MKINNSMFRFESIIVTVLLFFSCNVRDNKVTNNVKENIFYQSCIDVYQLGYTEIELAMENGDTNCMINYILSMQNPYISDTVFYDLLFTLADVTNFSFGTEDISDTRFYEISESKRRINKHNAIIIYLLYIESCLFMKNIDPVKSLGFQEWYYSFYDSEYKLDLDNDRQIILKNMGMYCS